MQFADKISSIWDEVSWGSDSFNRSSLYKIQSYTYVRGSMDSGDLYDYYRLDLLAGDYTLFVTTQGLNTPSVSNIPFKIEIVNNLGSVVLAEDISHPDSSTDQISFTYSGSGEYYLKITSITTDFDYRAAVYVTGAPLNPVPTGSGQLYLSPGNHSYGPIPGGDLTALSGSNLADRVTLAGDANVVLDPSFVRGNDALVILGDSSDYTMSSTVAGVTIKSAKGANIRVPAFGNMGGLDLQFNDVAFRLVTDDEGSTFHLKNTTINPIESNSGRGQLYLSSGNQTYGPVPGGDLTQIFGSNLAERVILASDANAILDPSFVRGNDVIAVLGPSHDFQISSSVAGVTIISIDDGEIRIPAFGSGSGLQIQFGDGIFQLSTDDGGNTFNLTGASGAQKIGITPTSIGSQPGTSYPTLDYLPDLTNSEMDNSIHLNFTKYNPTSPLISWDLSASASGSEKFALLHSIYSFDVEKGDIVDIYSTSFFDPFLLRIYDANGNTMVANLEGDDFPVTLSDGIYQQDVIRNWTAPYSGTYFVDASWDQGSFFTFYSLIIFVVTAMIT